MDSQPNIVKLQAPQPTASSLSFCEASVAGVTGWVKQLPMANTGEAARLLYQAIRELNSWKTSPATRLQVLELIRPCIYSISTVLNKHYIQSSIRLDTKQLKIANLSQALQGNLANGYKLVVLSLLNAERRDVNGKVFAIAIHRAISDLSHTILRAYQLYCSPPDKAWLEINQLYNIAEKYQVVDREVSDSQSRFLSKSSIRNTFVRIHLVGTAKPSNLRRQDLALLFDACELWADFVTMTDADNEDALFIINLFRDRAAQYRQHLRDTQKFAFRGMDTGRLVQALKYWAANPNDNKTITVPGKVSDTLLAHAIQSWGIHWQRAFRRSETTGQLSIAVGLTAVHYFSADLLDFDQVLEQLKPKSTAPNKLHVDIGGSVDEDVWSNAFDVDGTRMPENDAVNTDSIEFITSDISKEEIVEGTKYPDYQVALLNSSPGGYCIQWSEQIPHSIQAGELICIRENMTDKWSIGVIRWIKNLREQGTRLGIELLAPKAEVGTARVLQKTGDNGPRMRALVLPAIKAIAQPATLLLPRIPFRTGNKIELTHESLNGRFQLTKRLTSTSSFSQFEFRSLNITRAEGSTPSLTANSQLMDDDFDSIWKNL